MMELIEFVSVVGGSLLFIFTIIFVLQMKPKRKKARKAKSDGKEKRK